MQQCKNMKKILQSLGTDYKMIFSSLEGLSGNDVTSADCTLSIETNTTAHFLPLGNAVFTYNTDSISN